MNDTRHRGSNEVNVIIYGALELDKRLLRIPLIVHWHNFDLPSAENASPRIYDVGGSIECVELPFAVDRIRTA
jgi:hypothetical protein